MTKRTPNDKLRDLVAESGWTYDSLAKAVRAIAAECGATLRTNKSAVEHWIRGAQPHPDTSRYLATALSRRLGRLLTPADLGLATTDDDRHDSIGLTLGADPLDSLLPMWRAELDRRRFLTTSAYSVQPLPCRWPTSVRSPHARPPPEPTRSSAKPKSAQSAT